VTVLVVAESPRWAPRRSRRAASPADSWYCGKRRRARDCTRAELNEDMLDVRFDGLGCDAKTSCDFLVGSALGDQIEDVALADAEWV
jgi:hypothetical protein